jgi:hypothetical protein
LSAELRLSVLKKFPATRFQWLLALARDQLSCNIFLDHPRRKGKNFTWFCLVPTFYAQGIPRA